MLIVALPSRTSAGECKINGKPADYRIEGASLSYRHKDQSEWKRFVIKETRPASPGQTYYVCDQAGAPPSVTLGDDAHPASPPPEAN